MATVNVPVEFLQNIVKVLEEAVKYMPNPKVDVSTRYTVTTKNIDTKGINKIVSENPLFFDDNYISLDLEMDFEESDQIFLKKVISNTRTLRLALDIYDRADEDGKNILEQMISTYFVIHANKFYNFMKKTPQEYGFGGHNILNRLDVEYLNILVNVKLLDLSDEEINMIASMNNFIDEENADDFNNVIRKVVLTTLDARLIKMFKFDAAE